REFSLQWQRLPALLCRDRLADQRWQAARERLEHGVDVSGGDARAELIDKCVVGREVQGLPEQGRLVTNQVDDFFEMRSEDFELALLPRLEPAHLSARSGLGEPGDEAHRCG